MLSPDDIFSASRTNTHLRLLVRPLDRENILQFREKIRLIHIYYLNRAKLRDDEEGVCKH